MSLIRVSYLGALAIAVAAAQAPVINSVVNAASNITPGLPNAGIAQGAIFLIFGSNLGPGTISIAQNAFQNTTLSGTSASITVSGTTVAPLMYYTSASQVSALLPSNTPAGTGTITVTYNNQTSGKAAITVVASNLGIFTVTSNGQGSGIVTNPDYSLVSVTKAANCGGPYTTCGAANPSDTLILWATGLGPVSGSDASGAGLGVNMPNLPLKLWLGGVQATVLYQGRSGCCIGEDQIVFVVPANVPAGCAVPLAVQIANEISNYTVMPVAASGRTCTPSNPVLTPSAVQQLTTSSGPFTHSEIKLQRQPNFNTNGPGQNGYIDTGQAKFESFGVPSAVQPFFVSYIDDSPPGTCLVYNTNNPGDPSTQNRSPDAGAGIKVTGPNGSQNIAVNGSSATLGPGTFLSPGSYTVTGTGGADIGAFSAPFTIPVPPTLTSPASGPNIPVTRANGMTLTWSGGTPGSFVQISGANATDNTNTNAASFTCYALGSAGTFTIPPSVLLALPAGPNGGWSFTPTGSIAFSAPGLLLGGIQSSYATSISTTLQ